MCTLPTFPPLPWLMTDPCSLLGGSPCPIFYPNIWGLPAWGIQVVLWVLVYIPLTGFSCFLAATSATITTFLWAFAQTVQNALLALLSGMASLFVWAGPWAPILGALVVSVWLVIVVVVVLILVSVGEDVAKATLEA